MSEIQREGCFFWYNLFVACISLRWAPKLEWLYSLFIYIWFSVLVIQA